MGTTAKASIVGSDCASSFSLFLQLPLGEETILESLGEHNIVPNMVPEKLASFDHLFMRNFPEEVMPILLVNENDLHICAALHLPDEFAALERNGTNKRVGRIQRSDEGLAEKLRKA
jgi:hypothetical protein